MENKVRSILKKLERTPNASKHDFGHVLVVAGNIGLVEQEFLHPRQLYLVERD